MTAPVTVADIDAAWVSEVLGRSITEMSVQVIGAGQGFMGQLARVTLGDETSVIVKMPTADPGGQMIGQMMRVWEREHRFYTEIAPDMTGVGVPRCLHAGTDPWILILEDLAPAEPGDQVAGPTLEQARRVIDTAAALHGAWFDHPRLPDLTWMPDIADPMSESIGTLFPLGWPTFLARYADSLPERVLRWCEGFAPRVVEWIHSYADWPNTLIHGDFRLDNMFFQADGSVTLIDWQLAMRAPSTTDLVYFLGTNLPVDMRRAHQSELIDRYCRGLRAHGVPDAWSDPVNVLRGYAEGVLFYCTSFAASILTLDTANERGTALMDALVRRAFDAADELDAGGRLGLV